MSWAIEEVNVYSTPNVKVVLYGCMSVISFKSLVIVNLS